MNLDNDTIEMLGYNANISVRPQDNECQFESRENFLFDEEWDQLMYSAAIPEGTQKYLEWWREQVESMSQRSTQEEDLMMSIMTNMLEAHVIDDTNFITNLWREGLKRLHNLLV